MVIKEDLAKIVGDEHVVADKAILSGFASDNSFAKGKDPACAVRPGNVQDVQAIVKLANEKNYTLIPCSSDGPRFRGDTVPSVSNAVMVDLSRMDAVVRVNKRNKVAIVEPGVTFGKLQEEAGKKGLRVSMPLHPRKTKSVIGSCLEREPTLFPKYHWDMQDPLICMEVIFGTGDLFRTGSAAGPGTLEEQWAAGQAQKSPMGPSQTDLAKVVQGSQGTMGIVTWASIKLELMPKAQKCFCVSAQDLNALIDFTYGILKPKHPDDCLILNSLDLAAIYETNSKKKEKLLKNLPPWSLLYTISGYDHLPQERIDYIEKDIRDMAIEAGVKPKQMVSDISAEKLIKQVRKPSEDPFWKLRGKGGCQDIFFLTTLDRAPEFVGAMNTEADKHGFAKENIGVYIQPIQHGRNVHLEFNLMYDPDDSEETEKLKGLFDSAGKTLMDKGGFFSRPYGSWANPVYAKCPDTVSVLKKVKNIFDPKGVMNPGKLCFEKEV